jgi:hypothetical protein
MGKNGGWGGVSAAIVERVGGGVKNAHNDRPTEGDATAPQGGAKGRKIQPTVHSSKKICIFVFSSRNDFLFF